MLGLFFFVLFLHIGWITSVLINALIEGSATGPRENVRAPRPGLAEPVRIQCASTIAPVMVPVTLLQDSACVWMDTKVSQ